MLSPSSVGEPGLDLARRNLVRLAREVYSTDLRGYPHAHEKGYYRKSGLSAVLVWTARP